MKVLKDGKKKTIDIHTDCADKGIYVAVQHGQGKDFAYGGAYISLSYPNAIEVANQILAKCPNSK